MLAVWVRAAVLGSLVLGANVVLAAEQAAKNVDSQKNQPATAAGHAAHPESAPDPSGQSVCTQPR